MKRYPGTALCALLLFGGETLRAQQKAQLPVYREVERSGNLYSRSHNPSALWFSPVGNLLDFHADYDIRRGDLHDVDESSKINAFRVGISGQQRFDKVICSGSIAYNDGKEYARRWNSTLQVADDNPFILGDSIPSDFNTQRFNLSGTVAYKPLERLILALRLDYDTGSSANQTDPRPKTDGMHFVITPGVQYLMGGGFSLGLSGGFDLMSESISHEVIDPRESYVYFRFNGLGDYSTISTGTSLSYPRNYTGTEYTGALQFAWDGGRGVANLLEATYASSTQEARDGGAVFTFLGGDYSRTGFGVSDRLRFGNSRRTHNVIVGWDHKRVEGIWYEQTAYIDPDKNNQISYKVQASGLKNKETVSVFRAEYRFDKLRDGLPTFALHAAGRYEDSGNDPLRGGRLQPKLHPHHRVGRGIEIFRIRPQPDHGDARRAGSRSDHLLAARAGPHQAGIHQPGIRIHHRNLDRRQRGSPLPPPFRKTVGRTLCRSFTETLHRGG